MFEVILRTLYEKIETKFCFSAYKVNSSYQDITMDTLLNSELPQNSTPKKKRNYWKIAYYVVLHLLSAFAFFMIITALAVKFKWTNTKGSVDVNNRYFLKWPTNTATASRAVSKILTTKKTSYFKKLDF